VITLASNTHKSVCPIGLLASLSFMDFIFNEIPNTVLSY